MYTTPDIEKDKPQHKDNLEVWCTFIVILLKLLMIHCDENTNYLVTVKLIDLKLQVEG